MVTQIAVINFIPGGVPPHVKVSQGDTSERVLQFQCYFGDASYSIPSGSTVIVNGAKPGGTVFTRSATFSGNVVTLPCAESMTDTAGKIPCEIMVTTSSGTISSANFVLEVEGAPVNDAAVSESDLSAMTELAATASQAAMDAAASAAQADADVVNTVKYSDIVNTGTTTQAGMKALDAVQNNPNIGGTLAAQIASLAASAYTLRVVSSGSIDDVVDDGFYFLSTGVTGLPEGVNGWLIVMRSGNYLRQLFMRMGTPGANDQNLYQRGANLGTVWGDWHMFPAVQTKTVTGTTNAAGNLGVSIARGYTVIGARCLSPYLYMAIPGATSNSAGTPTSWFVKIIHSGSSAFTPLASEEATVEVQYVWNGQS